MSRVLTVLSGFNKRMCSALTTLVGGILGAIAVILFISVTMRYAFNRPITWSEDASNILLVWMTLLGAPAGLRAGTHVSVELLVEKLPGRVQTLFQAVSVGVVLWVSWMIVSHGFRFAMLGMRRIVPSLAWLPFGFAYLALPVGYGLLIFVCIELILRNIVALTEGRT